MARRDRSSSLNSHDNSSRRKRRRDDSSSDDEDGPEAGQRLDRKKRIKVDKLQQIGSDDFYAKSKEFRQWLRNDYRKPKDFAKLDAKDQRHYFKKFVKAWNKGKLDKRYYDATHADSMDSDQREMRQGETNNRIQLGPARPNGTDLTLLEEAEQDHRDAERSAHRHEVKRDRKEARREEQENRATGKDRILEKRAEQRESNKAMAASREQGDMEFGDDVLMGGSSSSFAEAVRRRDASRQNQQKQKRAVEKEAALKDLRSEARKKEDSTMAMFKAMAAARYGS